jgi:hypothetical protein
MNPVKNDSTIINNNIWPPKLDPLVEKQIIQDWLEQYPDFLEQYYWEFMTIPYYGTHNGYVAFYIPGMLDVIVNFKLAGTIFRFWNNCKIYLWKDGFFFEIIDAYLLGLITSEDISLIGDYHRTILRAVWISCENSFNEWYFDLNTISTIIP